MPYIPPDYLDNTVIANLLLYQLNIRGTGGDLLALDDEFNRQVYGLFGLSDEVKIIQGGKE